MKVLLVGLGRWGEKHLRVLTELGVELWAADVSAERRAFAVNAGVARERAVADFRRALPQVDAVDIVTPADNHLALAGECLRAGRDCFIEKPLTLTVDEGRRLAGIVADTGRILQVGHIFRFHPVTTALRERLAAGALGRVRYCTGRFAGFKRPRTDVGVTQTDAIHYFDLFAYLLERPATAVTATLRDYLGRGMDDCAFATVEYGDVTAVVEAGYFAPGTVRDCAIVGEHATIAADFGSSEVRVLANRHVQSASGWQAPEGAIETFKASGPEPLHRELALFLEAVAQRGRPSIDVHAGLAALRIVEAAQQSSALGRRVTL
ncbi:MAG TPA: Gfo/Idh/MocA family oxidoreductase [Methylomirabilota bacterium]|jgi:UDP-N-acetylglucosamine 3-dehydrogenase|nr:Gfo/Idh/MocA family oxidoreductase [Methylomirabilota bacterium]